MSSRTTADRDFRLFTLGQVSTAFGSALTAIVVPILAVEGFGATEWQIGLLQASTAAPVVALGFLVGVWSDRQRRKRRRLITLDLVSIAVLTALALGVAFDVAGFYWLLPVMVFFGISSLAVEALYFSHLDTVIGERTIMSARSRLIGGERLGSATGRGIAGALVWLGGYALPLFLDAALYLVNAVCLAFIRSPDEVRTAPPQSRNLRREVTAGFRILAEIRILRGFSTAGLLISVAEAMLLALLPILLLRTLGLPEALYGAVFIAASLAAAAGALACAPLAERMGGPAVCRIGLAGIAAGSTVLATGATIGGPVAGAVVVAVGLALLGLFGSVWNVGLTTAVTARADASVLGRVTLNVRTLTALAAMSGSVLGGAAGSLVGIRGAAWIAVAVGAIGAGLMAVFVTEDRTGGERDRDTAESGIPVGGKGVRSRR
ncbi:MFS transporter [Nocardia sp. NPDC050697]|uniref:MFS transporter n=1 Tax=Nocardia sp. NPDC050697 TaxID=3155158 RepID=UPI0033D0E21C